MRIGYIINSLDAGGGAFPVPRIIDVMRKAGHDVFVVALMERDGRARPLVEAMDIPCMVIGGADRAYLSTAWRLDRIVRRLRPDVLWTSLSHATVTGQLVGGLRGVPVVSWLHNAWLKPANIAIMRRTSGLTRHWVADSGAVARFGEQALGIKADRMSVWPIFQADPARPVAGMARAGEFRIGSLGRLHPNKGYHVLIEALALLWQRSPHVARAARVVIGGDGPARATLEQLAAARGVNNLEFAGFVDPGPFLASLNCYVQPSHHEGFCIAAHEAMCAGLPVIASPVGEMASSIRTSKAGMLVDHGDVESLAHALESFIEAPDQAFQMGGVARRWATAEFSAVAFTARGLAAMRAAGLPT